MWTYGSARKSTEFKQETKRTVGTSWHKPEWDWDTLQIEIRWKCLAMASSIPKLIPHVNHDSDAPCRGLKWTCPVFCPRRSDSPQFYFSYEFEIYPFFFNTIVTVLIMSLCHRPKIQQTRVYRQSLFLSINRYWFPFPSDDCFCIDTKWL